MQSYQSLLRHEFDERVMVTLASLWIYKHLDPQFAAPLSYFTRTMIAITWGQHRAKTSTTSRNRRERFKHDRHRHVIEDRS
jgi:hypothetical protein